jgi:hypothetical protein
MMIKKLKPRLTLVQPVVYQIKIPGDLTGSLFEWVDQLEIGVETDAVGNTVTVLTGKLDQAALLGLLRRLYTLGLPLISVVWINDQFLSFPNISESHIS